MPRRRKPTPARIYEGDLVHHPKTNITGTVRALRPVAPDTWVADVDVFGRLIPAYVQELRRIDRSLFRWR